MTKRIKGQAPTEDRQKDPVCGMQVDPAHSAASCEYEGTTYHFCSNRCHNQFKADPRLFRGRAEASSVSEELAQPETAAMQAQYTCHCGIPSSRMARTDRR